MVETVDSLKFKLVKIDSQIELLRRQIGDGPIPKQRYSNAMGRTF